MVGSREYYSPHPCGGTNPFIPTLKGDLMFLATMVDKLYLNFYYYIIIVLLF